MTKLWLVNFEQDDMPFRSSFQVAGEPTKAFPIIPDIQHHRKISVGIFKIKHLCLSDEF